MLEELKKHIQKLIALYEGALAENVRLKALLDESNAAKESCRKRITELEEQIDNLKLTAAFSTGGGDNSAAKEKIDRIIREIDKCISIIESQ